MGNETVSFPIAKMTSLNTHPHALITSWQPKCHAMMKCVLHSDRIYTSELNLVFCHVCMAIDSFGSVAVSSRQPLFIYVFLVDANPLRMSARNIGSVSLWHKKSQWVIYIEFPRFMRSPKSFDRRTFLLHAGSRTCSFISVAARQVFQLCFFIFEIFIYWYELFAFSCLCHYITRLFLSIKCVSDKWYCALLPMMH